MTENESQQHYGEGEFEQTEQIKQIVGNLSGWDETYLRTLSEIIDGLLDDLLIGKRTVINDCIKLLQAKTKFTSTKSGADQGIQKLKQLLERSK
ncbi:MAG: hypothetical protein UX04_C0010G0010 [Microgenomates group bacterium GW2011_GWF2_45_18]|nr:MAG: hypothetical protein UW18_C0013G0005 [Microgenomates group bacterium GW2011_GWF1_44_10]KKU01357.1 MAG: hypothetical protein UX04_C0010G0010 [Microgenomates group bacterium GW2011_GWF2_45_18]HAU99365.1 hypothetical protein [Candidatus Paceibacterota bacterium]HAX01343.1 hypothetical protein [Candidatus Paceibacterota bacterium]